MRNLLWLGMALLAASCADQSAAVPNGAASADNSAASPSTGAGGTAGVSRSTTGMTAGGGGSAATGMTDQGRIGTGSIGGAGGNGDQGQRDASAGVVEEPELDAGTSTGEKPERDAGPGDGGDAGAGDGGSGATLCDQLKAEYAATLPSARACDPGANGQCQQLVTRNLGCHCMTYANDAASLNDIKARYDAADCPPDPTCLAIFCTSPGTGTCTAMASGGACE